MGAIRTLPHQLWTAWPNRMSIFALTSRCRSAPRDAWDSTLAVFFCDRGDMLADHRLWHKTLPYEESARIPMILRPPNAWRSLRRQVIGQVVALRDILPALLGAARLAVSASCQRRGTPPLVRGSGGVPWSSYLHGERALDRQIEPDNHYLAGGHEKYIWSPTWGASSCWTLLADSAECQKLTRALVDTLRPEMWRSRPVETFAVRDGGLAQDGELLRQPLDRPIAHPFQGQPNNGVTSCLTAET